MSVWFVSRHPGAVEWAKAQGISVDHWVPHLSVEDVNSRDEVIGTIPVNMAGEVCAKGARYFNLSLKLPQAWRGKELGVDELTRAGARLEEYIVQSTKGA
jgi:CRISPR-associated protein Csx16